MIDMLSLPDFNYKQIAIHFAGGSGHQLRFNADNILIKDLNDKVVFQHSCHRLFALVIIGEISVTSIVIRQAIAFGFPIILMNRNMKVITRINCSADGNTLLRKKQYLCSRNLEIARYIIKQKIDNQMFLISNLRYLSTEDKETVEKLRNMDVSSAQNVSELMGLEGYASKLFFHAYFRPLGWTRREPRCKRDIYNLLLDIGYTYLFNFVEAMLSLYGFDLYYGVHHQLFYQRKSLVCDMVEPFRCIIDRRLRKAYNLKQINSDDFYQKNNQFYLSWKNESKYTRLFVQDILERKEDIFLFFQNYYRAFIRNKDIGDFPIFDI